MASFTQSWTIQSAPCFSATRSAPRSSAAIVSSTARNTSEVFRLSTLLHAASMIDFCLLQESMGTSSELGQPRERFFQQPYRRGERDPHVPLTARIQGTTREHHHALFQAAHGE